MPTNSKPPPNPRRFVPTDKSQAKPAPTPASPPTTPTTPPTTPTPRLTLYRKTLRYLHLNPTAPAARHRTFSNLLGDFLYYFLAAGLALHVFTKNGYTLGQAYGISMLPTIASFGDWLLISKTYRHGRNCHVGDVVSFRHPVNTGSYNVKRIVGMSGDFVLAYTPEEGEGTMVQVPEGHCWVVGDDLKWSQDSRMYGPLPLALVTGKVVAKWSSWWRWPEALEQGLRDAVIEDGDVD
ncbi:hypothetical protein LTR08_000211 [Meristemomyces frigidus]|nr:hypothetical protein LTR08_000211 [Meristemomyces frigidus]